MFAGGGLNELGPFEEYIGLNEYLPATNTWVPRTPIPTARYGVGGFTINGKGYVACGWHAGSQLYDLWQYDPVADSWTQKADFPPGGRYSTISVLRAQRDTSGSVIRPTPTIGGSTIP
jgi:hypothetical protein